mmetsp:Transcript_10966/g.33802  ORF Transcript_10966/g.33802 Transcript_10966/m.33802 type:complete len:271 (+) Transcript_10966:1270-2082(+)
MRRAARHVDVRHLALRLGRRLAVPVQGGVGHSKRGVDGSEGRGQLGVEGADDVDHGCGANLERRVPKREASHGPQVHLVLLCHARVHGIVARVVRARRNLIEENAPVGHREELDTKDTRAPERADGCLGDVLSRLDHLGRDSRGHDDGMALRVALLSPHHRVGECGAVARADDHDGELSREFTPALDVEGNVAIVGEASEGGSDVRGALDHRIAPPVVSKCARLEHEWISPLLARGRDSRRIGRIGVVAEHHARYARHVHLLQVLILNCG